MNRVRPKRLAGALLAVVFATAFFQPAVARAHAILESSSPGASQLLSSSPDVITLKFNEVVESTLCEIKVYDSRQVQIPIGRAVRSASDHTVVSADVPELERGVYVVIWRVVSSDGHPVNGAFPFEIGDVSSGGGQSLMEKVLADAPSASPLRWALTLARFLGFMAAVALIGLVALCWNSAVGKSPRVVSSMMWSTTLLALGAAGILLLQGAVAYGRSWGSLTDAALIGDVMNTRLGVAALVRLATVLLWGLLVLRIASRDGTLWRNTAVVASFLTIVSFAVSGHPSADSFAPVFITIDFVHLAAVSVWVGGVFGLVVLAKTVEIDELVRRFSAVATWAMPIAVTTGVIQSWHLAGGLDGITNTEYGKFLIAKVVVVMVVIALGSRARRRLHRSEAPSIRRTVVWEALLVVVVLALTASLVGRSPNYPTRDANSFSASLIQGGVLGEFTVAPTRVGAAEVHAVMSPPGGTLERVVSVEVTMSLPARDIPSIPVDMVELGPNHFSGIVEIPFAGEWQMQVRVVPRKNVVLLYSTTLSVND